MQSDTPERKHEGPIAVLRHGLRILFTLPIRFYQLAISPWLPASCIYTPSCSSYAMQAILKHGLLKGTAIAFLRIGRCSGGLFHGGEDPVPETLYWKSIFSEYSNRWLHNKKLKK
ncbi:membrane protein insertion efficiency factor YidD [Spirochaeta dissipatitropha]